MTLSLRPSTPSTWCASWTMARLIRAIGRSLITSFQNEADEGYAVRRNKKGQLKESDDVGRSLSQDVRRKSKTVVKARYGDKGDQKRK
jgi:hypothetical protein